MDTAAISEIAAEKLGRWRLTARGELGSLPRFLHAGERVVSMALGGLGMWRGRLLVATDRRLLLVHKHSLRPARCEAIPYERIRSVDATPKGGGWCELSLAVSGETVTVQVMSAERGFELALLLSGPAVAENASIERSSSASAAACESSPRAPLRLPLVLASWVPVVLFWADVLARDPALVLFLALAAAATIFEWRAGAPGTQIALGLGASVALALFVFDVLPFLLGLLVAVAAFGAEISYRRRADRQAAQAPPRGLRGSDGLLGGGLLVLVIGASFALATTDSKDSAGEGYPPGARQAFMSRCLETELGSRSSCACEFGVLRGGLGYDRYEELGGAEVLANVPALAFPPGADPTGPFEAYLVESEVDLANDLAKCL